jgi:ABC-type Fe3+ transport system permease subunit
MLGPFLGTPPPRNDKGKMVAHAVVWVILILCLLVLLLSVVLPS